MKNLFFLLLIALLLSCRNQQALDLNEFSYDFDFDQSTEGWTGDFADYPVGEESFYKLSFGHSGLPGPLDAPDGALKISGSNHSDDLFMFVKRKISGLGKNTTYKLHFDIRLASDAPTGWAGVGGAPGESVFLKAGASSVEPQKVPVQSSHSNYYRMNIDKDNQNNSGKDMILLGNIANGGNELVYRLIQRDNQDQLITATSNEQGELWLVIGTDSGFEAVTTLYYTQVKVRLEKRD